MRPDDAVTFKDCWCEDVCPYLSFKGEEYSGHYQCQIFGELDYYDGPLAECLIEESD